MLLIMMIMTMFIESSWLKLPIVINNVPMMKEGVLLYHHGDKLKSSLGRKCLHLTHDCIKPREHLITCGWSKYVSPNSFLINPQMRLTSKLTFILFSFIQQLMQDFMAAISNFSAPRVFVYLRTKCHCYDTYWHDLHYHPVNTQSPCSDPY